LRRSLSIALCKVEVIQNLPPQLMRIVLIRLGLFAGLRKRASYGSYPKPFEGLVADPEAKGRRPFFEDRQAITAAFRPSKMTARRPISSSRDNDAA
jgi:hypothetical protein